jgi:hypothetical protein
MNKLIFGQNKREYRYAAAYSGTSWTFRLVSVFAFVNLGESRFDGA